MLLSETGGGILNLEKSFLTDISLPDGDTLEIVVESIFGNGTASNGSHVDLICGYPRFAGNPTVWLSKEIHVVCSVR
ncbi:hypothetical protein ACEE23_04375 [Corynebacterium sp. 32222D000AT]|uniref:hypothetical protein n=1 Tax=unclassified Corynebacterium TaxID=2624378 RepID=UPI002AA070A5|nr:hypothetical protein [Mycobacteriaceae bacterium]MDY5829152.1 hypothetical protein [Corynebacterium sp.]